MKEPPRRFGAANAILLAIALIGLAISIWRLADARRGVATEPREIAGMPATIYRPASGQTGPAVVIAHGFAGSQQIMQSFALALARNGYIAVTFDFPGHGRNRAPMTGDVTQIAGTTMMLVESTARIAEAARALGDGRLALLGHSMASDVIVRYAAPRPDVAATVAVSAFSRAITADAPRNLLLIAGGWEGRLKDEALRAVGLAIAPLTPEPGVTYGDVAAGTGRRAVFAPNVEHASVLFSVAAVEEGLRWLDAAFGVARASPPDIPARGPWFVLLLVSAVLLARPLAALLPRVSQPEAGAGLAWRQLWLPVLLPMVLTPLILRLAPTRFLPVLVADYLAVHFAAYGLITWACLRWVTRGARPDRKPLAWRPCLIASAAVIAYGFAALGLPIHGEFANFWPTPQRLVLIGALLAGTLSFFLAVEWATRGEGAARFAYPAAKLAFVVSLAFAVALDPRRLFFLIIIVPVIAVFLLIYGLISGWTHRAVGHPAVSALANAVFFAWALGVAFPLIAG